MWLIALVLHALVPDKIIDLIEQDAKALLWAANPELHSNEDGTAQQSNRYMTETASYLTQTEGGGSISMHLRPHIKAYQKPNGCDQVPRPTPSTTWERRS